MTESVLCNSSQPAQYETVGYTGHIPGLRDQVGVTFGCATTQLLQPDSGGAASTPAWTGPSAVRPQWSVPGSQVEERPAWLGDAFDYYTAKQAPRSCHCSRSVLEVKGQGHSQGRAHGASRLDIFGKQYEFPCRPEWKQFERPRHVADTIETGLRRPLSNDDKTVRLHPAPSKEQRVCCPPFRSKSTACNFDPPLSSTSPYDLPITPGYTGVIPYSTAAKPGVNVSETMRHAMNRLACEKIRYQRRNTTCGDCATNVGQRFFTVGSNGQTRHLRDEDCRCPAARLQEDHQTIYPMCTGMIPNYTGHLPGYRWRVGHTFGLATQNLKRELWRSRTARCL